MKKELFENVKSTPKNMIIFDKIKNIQETLSKFRNEKRTIGFVPTMGALHNGHISLVKKAREENDVVVVSIFVNPTQFNNPEDLKNYPHSPESDQAMLSENKVDFLFSPPISEIYNEKARIESLELGSLGKVMEGQHRQGHFQGVVQVVSRLFEIVQPDNAYFGEKDFQQLTIIRFIVRMLNLPVKIIACPTVREKNGLAMSSRNLRLSSNDMNDATGIYKALQFVFGNWKKYNPNELKQKAVALIEANRNLHVEYVEIADDNTLEPVINWDQHKHVRCFAAVFCKDIRLIDNVKLY